MPPASALLRATAGAVILGKTVTTEFASMSSRRRRPIRTIPRIRRAARRAGSAAAVADGHVPLAFGTQTGGSVIRPAAYCGVVGYKPTFGDFSRVGIKYATAIRSTRSA